ncbi:Tn3 family transposase [Amycolatopsis arida]|uniref:Tn3 family transposase n=1 Tax=Amycolatopsis arida TaxID=587909 RepID=UPI003C7CF2EB
MAGRARRHRDVGGRRRLAEGHRPRRGSGCGGRLRTAGLHGRQAGRAVGLPRSYIIEGLLKKTSEVKPTTVHTDTQGQSVPVLALAHLVGFDLMPRIRNERA